MAQKVSEVVGTSTERFPGAPEKVVTAAAKTARNPQWFSLTELEGSVKNRKVAEYHATVKIYFDIKN